MNFIDLSHATRNLLEDSSSKSKNLVENSSRSSSANSFSSQASSLSNSKDQSGKTIKYRLNLEENIDKIKPNQAYDKLETKSKFKLIHNTRKIEMSFNFDKKYEDDEDSFEEESLIERIKSDTKSDGMESDDSFITKQQISTPSSKFNIVESIDPTFKQSNSIISSKYTSGDLKDTNDMSRGLFFFICILK